MQKSSGAGYALAAYSFWGVAPIYFTWVSFAAPLEVLAHRIAWSIPLLLILITLARQWPAAKALRGKQWGVLLVCAVLLSINWFTFIYAVQQQRIAETSLGYFINPLVSIVLGWLFLRERMRPWQWLAACAALLGVVVELYALGELPWLALTLAFTFGLYGLLRKQLAVSSTVGLGAETLLVLPLALGYLLFSSSAGQVPERDVTQLLLLALGGAVTVTPLVLFASAAVRMPLSTLGFFQYIAPTLALMLAVFYYNEHVSQARWISFACVWLGLIIFSVEGLWQHRKTRLSARSHGQPLTQTPRQAPSNT